MDPDIDARLAELEREEEVAEAAFAADLASGLLGTAADELDPEERSALAAIKDRKKKIIAGAAEEGQTMLEGGTCGCGGDGGVRVGGGYRGGWVGGI